MAQVQPMNLFADSICITHMLIPNRTKVDKRMSIICQFVKNLNQNENVISGVPICNITTRFIILSTTLNTVDAINNINKSLSIKNTFVLKKIYPIFSFAICFCMTFFTKCNQIIRNGIFLIIIDMMNWMLASTLNQTA